MSGTKAAPLTVASWNIWGIPFASHAVLSRPGRLGEVAAGAVLSSRLPGDRTVIAFQEAWAFKTGIFQPVVALARAFERSCPSCCTARHRQIFMPKDAAREVLSINGGFTLFASVVAAIGGLCCPCSNLRDDETKEEIVASLKSWGLRYSVGTSGNSGMSSARGKLMDSGLLICSSVAPLASGFTPFAATGVEGAANKGFLWILLPPADGGPSDSGARGGGQLVVTTHMHADQLNSEDPAAVRALQRAEFLAGIEKLKREYNPSLVVVCGDFNEEARDNGTSGLHPELTEKGFVRLTSCPGGTCIKDDGSGRREELDHIYASGPTVEKLTCEKVPALHTPWSDHSLLWVNRIVAPRNERIEGRL